MKELERPAIVRQADDRGGRIAAFKKRHAAFEKKDRDRLQDAIAMGEILCRERDACVEERREWLKVLETEYGVSQPSANNWMFIYTNRGKLLPDNNMGYTEALNYLRGLKDGQPAAADEDVELDDRQEELRARVLAGEAVVVNMNEDEALVKWATAKGLYARVDRATEWGNPFRIDEDGDREAVIHKYEHHYLPHKDKLMSEVGSLRGKVLGCHCAPEACHADILARLANEGSPNGE